jgi:NAD dependent epimerase/dehydratase family enzyme
LSGAYNIRGTTITNKTFSKALAKSVNRWMLPFGVPAFVMKMILGEMSQMLLNGVNTNSEKLKSTGFEFKFEEIGEALG